MKTILAAVIALGVSQAFATTAKPAPQPSVQAQIEALKSQVAALQQQVDKLKAGRVQQVCISLKCA